MDNSQVEKLYNYIQDFRKTVKENKVWDHVCNFIDEIDNVETVNLFRPINELGFLNLVTQKRQPFEDDSIPIPILYKIPPRKGIYHIQLWYNQDFIPCMTYTQNINEVDYNDDSELLNSSWKFNGVETLSNYYSHTLKDTKYKNLSEFGYIYLNMGQLNLCFDNTTDEEGEVVIYISILSSPSKLGLNKEGSIRKLIRKEREFELQKILKKRMLNFVTERAEAFTLYSINPKVREYWENEDRERILGEFESVAEEVWG